MVITRTFATLVVAISALYAGSAATITFSDGMTHTIDAGNSFPYEGMTIDDGALGSPTTVKIVEGGEVATAVENPSSVSGESILDIEGGEIGGIVTAYDNATILLHGSGQVSRLMPEGSSIISITGGQIVAPSGNQSIFAVDESSVTISAGSLYGAVVGRGASTVLMTGGTVLDSGLIIGADIGNIIVGGSTIAKTIVGFDESTVSVAGGDFSGDLEARGSSLVTLSGGSFGRDCTIDDDAVLLISGGEVTREVTVKDRGYLEIAGGILSDQLQAIGESTVLILVQDSNYPPGPVSDIEGTLLGTLLDGSPLSLAFGRASTAIITISTTDPTPACDDGADNDGDGVVDHPADPGCSGALDNSEKSAFLICDDGADNDGDGLADLPNDPGCDDHGDASELSSALVCDDGVDNDGDGLADHRDDPGCDHPLDESEKSPLLVCDDGVDNDDDGLTDFPADPDCYDPLGSSESPPPAPLTKGQQACVNEMNKNGAKVNKAQLKENEKCLKDYQKNKLAALTFDGCIEEDRNGKVANAKGKTESGEEKKCDVLLPDDSPDFAHTDADTVNEAAVEGAVVLVDAIFGDPATGLVRWADNKAAAKCQLGMLKEAGKLENMVLKEVNKAKKKALKEPTINRSSALAAELEGVFSNDKITTAEGKLAQKVRRACADLGAPDTIFPGACADAVLGDVSNCVIAAARCRACLAVNAMDNLALHCDQADDGDAGNESCL